MHDLRRALKRWRAILRLIAPMVGAEAEEMRIAARDFVGPSLGKINGGQSLIVVARRNSKKVWVFC